MRSLTKGLRRIQAENYSADGIQARELRGSNFGVIGLGNIGKRVAELAAGFGASVYYWSRNKKDTPFTYVTLTELLQTCTYISVNVAESEETIGLLNSTNLPLIRSGSILISTVPPPIIGTAALLERLSKGDVTFISDHAIEMTPEDLAQLKALDNCILYPTIAARSGEARIAKQEALIGNLKGFLHGKARHKVNNEGQPV